MHTEIWIKQIAVCLSENTPPSSQNLTPSMEFLSLSHPSPSTTIPRLFPSPNSIPSPRRSHLVPFPLRTPKTFRVFASSSEEKEAGKDNGEIKFSVDERIEIEWGKIIGENPKLTLAKIMERRADPSASLVETENFFYENKGKVVEMKELPLDVPRRGTSVNGNGFDLVKPVLKIGNEVDENSKSQDEKKPTERVTKVLSTTKLSIKGVNLQKPRRYSKTSGDISNSMRLQLVRPRPKDGFEAGHGVTESLDAGRYVGSVKNKETRGSTKSSVSNLVMRKPNTNMESMDDLEDEDLDNSARFTFKPNLSLKTRAEPVKKEFSGMTLRKPECFDASVVDQKQKHLDKVEFDVITLRKPEFRDIRVVDQKQENQDKVQPDVMILRKPDLLDSVVDQKQENPDKVEAVVMMLRKPEVLAVSVDQKQENPYKVKADVMKLRKPESLDVSVVDQKQENPNKVEADVMALRKPESLDASVVDQKQENPKKVVADVMTLRKPESLDDSAVDQKQKNPDKVKANVMMLRKPECLVVSVVDQKALRKPESHDIIVVGQKQEKPDKVEPDVIPCVFDKNLTSGGVTSAESGLHEKQPGSLMQKSIDSSTELVMLDKSMPITETTRAGYSSRELGSGEIKAMTTLLEGSSRSTNDLGAVQRKMEGSELLEPNHEGYWGQNKVTEAQVLKSISTDFSAYTVLRGTRRPSGTPVVKSSALHEVYVQETLLDGSYGDIRNSLLPSPPMLNDADWERAENLFNSKLKEEVEIISCSTRGFYVSFGSLIGLLPYGSLTARWKFLAFEPWLRKKGLDLSKFRLGSGASRIYQAPFVITSSEARKNSEVQITEDMGVEDVRRVYEQEKIQFVSSFIGQRIKVDVSVVDKNSGKLIFCTLRKEKEEKVEKRRDLMARLRTVDMVECRITSIASFGVFVEVEGVPALIHQTEISWDSSADPGMLFRIGQVVEAKVHRLDFAREHIFLSLKEVTADPLKDSVSQGVGALNGSLEENQTDYEWPEVDALIQELEKIEKVHNVSKGRLFLSPGLAPTFQVYMASVVKDEYKLLARSENKVQDVMVQASLTEEEMKAAVHACTTRVE
ncbi:Small ribosomal subunit protein bS1-like protein [Drosera capensis]